MSEKDKTFRFKEFIVNNSLSAMRVNTDGVILGAWAEIPAGTGCIWDVGSGTGLIALMLAQRCNAEISAIEIDDIACEEMMLNFNSSKWSNRLHPIKGDFCDKWETLPRPQLIVSNPPFFDTKSASLMSNDDRRATARHESALGFLSLIEIASKVLNSSGKLCFISPYDRNDEIEYLCVKAGMFIHKKTFIKTTPMKAPKRILWSIGKSVVPTEISNLTIYSSANVYSQEFKQLVKDYYLYIND